MSVAFADCCCCWESGGGPAVGDDEERGSAFEYLYFKEEGLGLGRLYLVDILVWFCGGYLGAENGWEGGMYGCGAGGNEEAGLFDERLGGG